MTMAYNETLALDVVTLVSTWDQIYAHELRNIDPDKPGLTPTFTLRQIKAFVKQFAR